MTNRGPYLVRIPDEPQLRSRHEPLPPPTPRAVQQDARAPGKTWIFQRAFIFLGFLCLTVYGYSLANQYVYQAYENWAFDQQIAGRPQATFADYMREATPFGIFMGKQDPQELAPVVLPPHPSVSVRPEAGDVLGRVDIPRLALSAIVREGVDAGTLSRAVGHVPSTSLAGEQGNFAIAAHRDTLFRALKDIREGDVVTFEAMNARYTYEVFATRIVKPSDVSVLHPDGGLNATNEPGVVNVIAHPDHLLTMITCYPFYYVGSAPERFIVQARLISSAPMSPHRT